MNLPSACSKDDSSAPVYLWEWQSIFFDLEVSHTFLDKAFKVVSIKKKNHQQPENFKAKKVFIKKPVILVIIHSMNKDIRKQYYLYQRLKK